MRRLLGVARLVTLTGVGGVGKTRLALEVAADSVKAFGGGVWLVDLAAVRELEAVPVAVAAALGVADVGPRPVLESLVAYLSGRRGLLVLDNCEHVVEACAPLAQHLLSSTPDLRILATSRETLHLTGEHVFAVTPLPEADATELLRQRASAVRPGFEVTDVNQALVARLCADLDGLPLAIELAASRLRTLSVQQVVERLEDRFALLTAGSRAAEARQRTLRAAVDWSWELCSREEQFLWSRLSVFAGGFTLEAAEGVCAGEGIEAREVADLMDRLVVQSLVEHPDSQGTTRYRMLETIRQYGWDRLVEAGDDDRVRRRHREFFALLVERLHQEWFGPRQAEILAQLRAEHANLLAAMEPRGGTATAAVASGSGGRPKDGPDGGQYSHRGDGDRQSPLAMAGALVYHWVAGGFLGEGRRQLERALSAAPEPTRERARALVTAAYVAEMQFDLAAAGQWLEEAEQLAERLDEPELAAQARGHQGVTALYAGRLEEALSHVEHAVASHAALGDRFGEVTWRCALAIFQTMGSDPRALETGRQALAAAEAHGERWARAHLLSALGRHAWTLGDQNEARQLTVSGLGTLRGFNETIGVAKMVEQLAWITASGHDHPQAARLLGAARSLRNDVGITIATGDPRDEEHHARCETQVRQALGLGTYERALAYGAALGGTEEVIAFALGEGTRTEPAGPSTADAAAAATAAMLTPREQQVAALVAQGMTNRRIAAELVLSPRTVDGHVDRILTKLGFSARAQIAAWWTAHHVSSR
ncbi:ATP-binding protein [Streptomyces sp. NPDC005374]|uniref:ATP-binding protein n=1 Tax=Streptomyces sp. NPDC005374 TaxID=3364713 RepID=UPI00368878C7